MDEDKIQLQKAFALFQQGRFSKSADVYKQLIGNDPKNCNALHYFGILKVSLGQLSEGKMLIERSLADKKTYIPYLENYVSILFQASEYEQAELLSSKAIRDNGPTETFEYIKAVSLCKLKRFREAVEVFNRLLVLSPNNIAAHTEIAAALAMLGDSQEALLSIERALKINPRFPPAIVHKANILLAMKKYDEALSWYLQALSLNQNLSDAHVGCGHAFKEHRRYDEAIAAYDKATALKPDLAIAWAGRGHACKVLRRYDEAIAAYDKALALDPDLDEVEGERLIAKQQICSWKQFKAECDRLLDGVEHGKRNAQPLAVVRVSGSLRHQQLCSRIYISRNFPAAPVPIWKGERYSHDKIRIGYISGDYYQHPVAILTAEMFEMHDRSKFEIIAVSFGPDTGDEMHKRLKGAFDQFIDVKTLSDRDVAQLMRNLEIDIAIDLKGFTGDPRGILSQRAAPIQVNYLGYPGTMGASYIDYLIADRTLIPNSSLPNYDEKIVFLPNSYQANDSKRPISGRSFSRRELGLPQSGFVFCCFNNNHKIVPDVFDCWMRILKRAEGSVLWLFEDNATAAANLRKEAEARGIEGMRLVFAKPMPLQDHLARHGVADLFLDTLPYNAHTTASDALWAGLPVLTQIGEAFAGRVAASLLNAVTLPELVTTSRQAYEDLAVEFATNPDKLVSVKHKLTGSQLSAPLFDTKIFTKHIESAYQEMHERHQKGLLPDHIYVPK